MFKRFFKDNTANVASMFAFAAFPMIGATGAAIDYSRAYEQRMVMQDALDAAALAANKLIGTRTEAQILAEANAFYHANVDGKVANAPNFTMTIDRGTITLNTTLTVPTSLLGILGVNDIVFDIMSRTIAGSATYEIVLVLDTSGSMAGTKITTLRTAAKDLIDKLFLVNQTNPKPDPVKFAVVPFAASVNVGTGNRTAAWMGTGAETAGRSENFWQYAANGTTQVPLLTNRFTLYDQLSNVDWLGCVEERRAPYDVNDATPVVGTPDTMFIPMFAPDEADDNFFTWESVRTRVNGRWVYVDTWTPDSQSYEFSNTYLSDYGGARGQVEYVDRREAQANVAKYTGASVAAGNTGLGQGPNLHCNTQPIMALTTSQTAARAKIDTLQASGNTNITAGVTWGWRALSSTMPFAEGRPSSTVDNHKIMILMTDGANTYNGTTSSSNFNKSDYSAWSYIANNHLGTTSGNSSTIVGKMNERTILACQNLKAAGDVTVYTIAFQLPDAAARQILADCATDPSKAYDSQSNAELLTAFNAIAEDISTLRIAQ